MVSQMCVLGEQWMPHLLIGEHNRKNPGKHGDVCIPLDLTHVYERVKFYK